MPFHNGVYYPYTSDTQGTHSSAGIPSLLNSPLSQQHSGNGHPAQAPGMTSSSGASTVLPFKFRPRIERSMDWRRLNAVDVDLVVSQLDVDALQDHLTTVTFCSLDGERCQRCQSPVDPVLVKLLRLAQLTVEWLLHCQEILTISLQGAEERLVAAGMAREQLLVEQKKEEVKVTTLTQELKQRKKIIRMQQSMLAPSISGSHKCPGCDKSFLNSNFLQSHLQRRHPDVYENQLRSDSEKKSQIDSLTLEISSLKDQILQQQQTLQAKTAQEKEQQTLHKDLLREFDCFKAEEMTRTDRKIEDGIRREMEILYTRNIQALNEANQNQTAKHEKAASPVHSQQERDVDNYKEMQQALQKLEHQLKKQDKKWEARLQEIKAQHESEKNQLLNELSRTQLSVSEQEERSKRLQQEMERRLQEKKLRIRALREQIKTISWNPPTKIVEVPVIATAPPPEPKPKRVVPEEQVCALKLDPIQELSEEERDSSSFSESRAAEKKPEPALEKKKKITSSVLMRNTSMKRDIRRDLEESLIQKLEKLGVKRDQSGLKSKALNSLLAKIQTNRERSAKDRPGFFRRREELKRTMEQRADVQWRGSDPAPEPQIKSRQSVQVLQIRPRSSSRPPRAPELQSGPAAKQPKTPQPAPRTKPTVQPKTSTPNTKTAHRNFTSKTPPFSSDEESEEDDSDMEEEQPQKPPSRKSPQPKLNQANQVQIKASKPSTVQARTTKPKPLFTSNSQQALGSAGGVVKTAVTKIDSEEEDFDDWSDVSELQEIDQGRLQSHKDQNGNVEKKNFGKENKISDLINRVEKQFADRGVKKPAGGISILPQVTDVVQELMYTDLEESSEWLSSLEERREMSKPMQSSGPMRNSLESSSRSVWGTSSEKAPKSAGLTGAGTGSTLKSTLCSLSDISDSEEISNKHDKRYG